MSHVRTQLRDAVIAAIAADVPGFGGRVDKVRGFSRNRPLMPSCEVSTPGEATVGISMDRLLSREIDLEVSVSVIGNDGIEDSADDLAVGIETAIYASATVMGLVKEITPSGMQFEMQADGESRAGRMTLTWACVIVTREGDPKTAL